MEPIEHFGIYFGYIQRLFQRRVSPFNAGVYAESPTSLCFRGEIVTLKNIERIHKKPKADKETRLLTAKVGIGHIRALSGGWRMWPMKKNRYSIETGKPQSFLPIGIYCVRYVSIL